MATSLFSFNNDAKSFAGCFKDFSKPLLLLLSSQPMKGACQTPLIGIKLRKDDNKKLLER
jgi:hypothetical protein